jgi:hypothetical protein
LAGGEGRRLPLRPLLRRGCRPGWAIRGSGGCDRGSWWRVCARVTVRWRGGGIHRGRPRRRGGSPLCRPARARPGVGRSGCLNRRQGEGHGLHLGAPAAINAARSPRPWPACATGGHHGDHRSDGGPSGRSDVGYGWHTA